jgi:serine/threonine protein kinase
MAATEAGSSSSSLSNEVWRPFLDNYLRRKAGAEKDLKHLVCPKHLPAEVLSLYKSHYSSRPEWALRVASHLYQYSKLDVKQTWLQALIASEMVHDRTCLGRSLDADEGMIMQSKKGTPRTIEYTQKSSAIYVHLSQKKFHVMKSASSLGKGASGEVSIQLRIAKDSCQLVANKRMLFSEENQLAHREHAILTRLAAFPYIIAPFDLICHPSLRSASLMLELANQGPIAWKKVEHLPLKPRLELIQQALTALVAVHSIHLAHADLKPDNLLLTKFIDASGKERCEIRLIDFAFAVHLKNDESRTRLITSAYYQPIEVHRKEALNRSGWQLADVFTMAIIGIEEILGTNPAPHDALAHLNPASQANSHPDSSLTWRKRKELPVPMQLVFDGMLANSSKNRLTAKVALKAFAAAMEKMD